MGDLIIIKRQYLPDRNVQIKKLLEATKNHQQDVYEALQWCIAHLARKATRHDETKIDDIEGFYRLAMCDFNDTHPEAGDWWEKHVAIERHHLNEYCPEDVNLFDVLEQICDRVVGGMALNGRPYVNEINPNILIRAYDNTFKMIFDHVEVE